MRKPRGYWLKSAQELAKCYTAEDSHTNGYIYVKRDGKTVLLHVWIWEQINGAIPEGYEIDHVNGIRWDCRLVNLRCIPKAVNMKNKSIYSNNNSGVTGVTNRIDSGIEYWCTQWIDPITGKQRKKRFSVQKNGYEVAKQLAINYRENILKDFIKNHGYTERHGK